MTGFTTRKLLSTFTIVFLLMVSRVHAAEPPLRLVAPDYPPYYGPYLPGNGFVTELILAAFTSAGYEGTVKFLPWKRAVQQLKMGGADGLFTVWHRKERESWAVFSDPIYFDELVFIKKKGLKVDYRHLDDLKPYIISDVLGYSYPDSYQKAALKKKNAMNDNEAVKRMVLGGADLALVDKIQGIHLLKQMNVLVEDYDILMQPLDRVASHLAISSLRGDAQKIVADFNAAIRQLVVSGEAKKIAEKSGFAQVSFQ